MNNMCVIVLNKNLLRRREKNYIFFFQSNLNIKYQITNWNESTYYAFNGS